LPEAQEAQVGLQLESVPHRLQTSRLEKVDQVHEDLQGWHNAP
jgi:hypothetical protein